VHELASHQSYRHPNYHSGHQDRRECPVKAAVLDILAHWTRRHTRLFYSLASPSSPPQPTGTTSADYHHDEPHRGWPHIGVPNNRGGKVFSTPRARAWRHPRHRHPLRRPRPTSGARPDCSNRCDWRCTWPAEARAHGAVSRQRVNVSYAPRGSPGRDGYSSPSVSGTRRSSLPPPQ
jgi:hypothetical protein